MQPGGKILLKITKLTGKVREGLRSYFTSVVLKGWIHSFTAFLSLTSSEELMNGLFKKTSLMSKNEATRMRKKKNMYRRNGSFMLFKWPCLVHTKCIGTHSTLMQHIYNTVLKYWFCHGLEHQQSHSCVLSLNSKLVNQRLALIVLLRALMMFR